MEQLMTLWAIRQTTRSGATFLDYTSVRTTRRESWAAYTNFPAGTTDKWRADIKRRRRNGTLRAVKVTLKEIQG
jgi:hypothetical protein